MIERKIKLVDAVLPDKEKVGMPASGLRGLKSMCCAAMLHYETQDHILPQSTTLTLASVLAHSSACLLSCHG